MSLNIYRSLSENQKGFSKDFTSPTTGSRTMKAKTIKKINTSVKSNKGSKRESEYVLQI